MTAGLKWGGAESRGYPSARTPSPTYPIVRPAACRHFTILEQKYSHSIMYSIM